MACVQGSSDTLRHAVQICEELPGANDKPSGSMQDDVRFRCTVPGGNFCDDDNNNDGDDDDDDDEYEYSRKMDGGQQSTCIINGV